MAVDRRVDDNQAGGLSGVELVNAIHEEFDDFHSRISALEDAAPDGLVVLPADVTNNNAVANTMADVTGLEFPVLNGGIYKFRFVIAYTAAATTTGSRWSINGPAATTLHYRSDYSLTSTSRTFNEGQSAYNSPASSNATSAATGSNMAVIEGIIEAGASGNVVARFASEVAGSAIVAKGGRSFVEYKRIN